MTCENYRPDHNGECLNCDEPLDAHGDDPDLVVSRAIARMIYEQETGHDWHTAPTDPGFDATYLRLAGERRR